MTAFDPVADVPEVWHFARMRLMCASLIFLLGCSSAETQSCFEGFCLPANATLIGEQEPADFHLYQFEWQGKRFGIYAGDFPDFDTVLAENQSIEIDPQAKLLIEDQQGQLMARLGENSPRFLHFTGPCNSFEDCPVAEFADTVRRVR